MYRRWIELLLVFTLGVVVPAAVFTNINQPAELTEPTVHFTAMEEVRRPLSINVLDEEGIIHTMDLEDYIFSVVLCEMPSDFELEALKAQAVVARTYAIKRQDKNEKHEGAAVCTNFACCQGYRTKEDYLRNGGTEDGAEKVRRAVTETAGKIIVYNGQPAEATYFSCSGGRTEDAQAVWGSDIPYLKAIDSPGEENAVYFTDTVTFNREEFLSSLEIEEKQVWIDEISYTDGGGVDSINVCGMDFSGTQFRKLLGLRSTAFVITAVGDSVTITTRGFGHRVGMSQYGADAMAVNGSTYEEILNHYYQGIQISECS